MEEVSSNECPVHGSDNETCGGPHDEIFTDLGWEVVRLGDGPLGTRIAVTPDAEQARYSTKYRRLFGPLPDEVGD